MRRMQRRGIALEVAADVANTQGLRPNESVSEQDGPEEEHEPKPMRRRRRWDAATKRGLALKAMRMRHQGHRWSDISNTLDVLEGSLRQWVERYEDEAGDKPVSAVTLSKSLGALSITTPDGFRIDGLDVESACSMLDLLRRRENPDLP